MRSTLNPWTARTARPSLGSRSFTAGCSDPDLAPLRVTTPPDATLAQAISAAEGLGWFVVARDAEGGVFYARDETGLFRFVDDVVVRVRPEDRGSKIDVRSKSRDGQGDMGANAARIRALLAAIDR